MTAKPLAVVIGFIGKLPMAGMTLYNLHYVEGLRELGYEIHYVERQNTPYDYYDPRSNEMTEETAYGLEYLRQVLPGFGVLPSAISLVDSQDRCHGAAWSALETALDGADFVLDLADPTWFDALERCPRRIFVDGDPLFTQVSMLRDSRVAACLERYDVLFTYCTRMGHPDCTVPTAGRAWMPTRPVVATRLWEADRPSSPGSLPLTTVLNWSASSEIELDGVTYGQKGRELERFLDAPSHLGTRCVLALGGAAPRDVLGAHGWALVDPLEVTASIDSYRAFIGGSRADLGLAKHAYVASRGGWFSDRSTCYLASGRPVLHQDTGYTDWLADDEGVLAFRDLDTLLEGLARLDADYDRHAQAARRIAEEYFEARVVIGRMLEEAGLR